MPSTKEEVSIKGKRISVDSTVIAGKNIVVNGNILKIASVKDDVCDEGIDTPAVIIEELSQAKVADIFTFDQKLPDLEPRYDYYFEWANHALLEVESFDFWWNKQIGNDARRMVRKAEKLGISAKIVPFNDDLVSGIKEIYDEAPIRRGKPFWHYQKSFLEVKRDNASFLDRSDFIGAYLDNELIGFDKIIYTGNWAAQIQLIAMLKHRDKCPTNLMLAKAVETCANKGIRYLTYGSYMYGNKGADPLTDFKKRNGFRQANYPRYFIPLTLKGKIALKFGFHRSLVETLPPTVVEFILAARSKYYQIMKSKVR